METVPVVVATVAPGPGEPSVLRFDGSDDRVTVPYSPTFPTEVFSFGAWIKLAPPRGRAAIFARGEDDNSFNLSWQLYVLSDGTLEVMLEDLMGSHESVARSQLPPAAATDRPILPIPERLEGSVFDLNMRRGEREFLPGLLTPTKGYNGNFLGPTLAVRSGRDVTLNVTNNIGVATTTHWHGMHVPAVMDGGPHQGIEPGETWTASFPVLNRAATYWYHPHLHASLGQGAIFDPMGTGYQVYEGLAGMLIVEDDTSDMLPLPRSYGQDDIPLILQDRRFNEDGTLMHFPSDFNPTRDPALRKGGHFLVNGVEGPALDVGAQVVRLRILNASNARVYNLGFSDNRTFHQVVSDGGFLAAPVPMFRLVLAPAERAEILIDLSADEGKTLSLRSFNGGNGTTFVPFRLQIAGTARIST